MNRLVQILIIAVGVFLALWAWTEYSDGAVRPDNPTAGCPGDRYGLAWYKDAYNRHRDVRGLPHAPPTVFYGCQATERRAAEWRAKAYEERVAADRWEYVNFAWEQWLPANWVAVAQCETHLNWHHSNSSFVSAFGISRAIYDSDAAYMGAPPWSDVDPPTPREQYLAALGHYRRFGDGWGCPGP